MPMNLERAQQPQSQGNLAAPGAQLKVRREAMGWTIEHVADQLKLAPRQVIALEEGDFDHLPNMAVVRGFVRAYAKVVKLDAAPLVAMIDVNPAASQDAAPARREISASFSETRFPSLTQRAAKPIGKMVGAVALVAAAAAFGAYQAGLISPAMLTRSDKGAAPAGVPLATPEAGIDKPGAAVAPETTPAHQNLDVTPVPSASVPLISVSPASAGTALGAPAAAAGTGNALVLNVRQDSWVEIRRAGAAPLISRMVKAGSTETFDIAGPALLIVGKPGGVDATLRGAALELTPLPGGTTTRLNIK